MIIKPTTEKAQNTFSIKKLYITVVTYVKEVTSDVEFKKDRWMWLKHFELEEARQKYKKNNQKYKWWLATGLLILIGGFHND